MATVPKAVPVAAQPNVPVSRFGSSSRASSTSNNVDELQTSSGVSFDSAEFRFREDDRAFLDHGGNRHSRHSRTGLFTAPTQAFAAMFGGGDSFNSSDDPASNVKSPRFAGLVSKAIAIYENNARVIAGDINVLETSISVVL